MDVGVLFSGGADSALAACLLETHCDVTLVSCRFSPPERKVVADAASALDLPLTLVELDHDVLDAAVETAHSDGYPRNAIQEIHEHALETVASGNFAYVADGTRRDDRTPTVSRSLAQRVEDRHDVGHLAPLAGLGHRAVNALQSAHLEVTTGPSEELSTGDYETELRTAVADCYGRDRVEGVFPAHEQSRVIGRLH